MKKIVVLTFSLLLAVAGITQKQVNDANAQVREVKNFHAIRVSTGIELQLSQGGTEAVAVSASDAEFRNRIKTEVQNGVLRIYYDSDFLKDLSRSKNKKLKAYVSFINLDGIDASSGASVNVDGSLKVSTLNLDVSSGATFHGRVEANTMKVDQSSGAVINISGAVNSLNVDGSSGSIFRGYDLAVNNCEAESSSGSGVQITVNKELSAEASSGGYVSYKGNGVIRNIRTGSGGSVNRKS
jgi:hypothetical protein